jgi:hypothetical protein
MSLKLVRNEKKTRELQLTVSSIELTKQNLSEPTTISFACSISEFPKLYCNFSVLPFERSENSIGKLTMFKNRPLLEGFVNIGTTSFSELMDIIKLTPTRAPVLYLRTDQFDETYFQESVGVGNDPISIYEIAWKYPVF